MVSLVSSSILFLISVIGARAILSEYFWSGDVPVSNVKVLNPAIFGCGPVGEEVLMVDYNNYRYLNLLNNN